MAPLKLAFPCRHFEGSFGFLKKRLLERFGRLVHCITFLRTSLERESDFLLGGAVSRTNAGCPGFRDEVVPHERFFGVIVGALGHC
jgi:hypothetical protein